jgi:NitT/TauT family transport system ATP-binding protein
LVCHPQVLLLDEPFAGLDNDLKRQFASLLRKLTSEREMTTIMVSHDPGDATLLPARRVIALDSGTVCDVVELNQESPSQS